MNKFNLKKFSGMNTIASPKKVGANQATDMRDMVAKAGMIRTRNGFLKYNTVGFGSAITGLYGYQPRFKTAPMILSAFNVSGEGNLAVDVPTYSSAPSTNAGADQSKDTGDTVTLDGSASARATSYLWTQTSGTTVTLSSTTAVSPTFTMPFSDVTFQLTVTNFWGSDTDTVDVTNNFLIHNVTELQAMQDDLTASYKLANDIDASATSTWNAGAGFVPIGDNTNKFTGIFDGNEHTITDLFINRTSTTNNGLFGWLNGAEIKNIGLINVDISSGNIVGALVGTASYSGDAASAITNCYSTGSVAGSGNLVGGLVGRTSSTFSTCYSTCSVNGSGFYTGGLIGWSNAPSITDCYATGVVVGVNEVGGLVGECSSDVLTNCYSTGAVSGSSSLGGLVGVGSGSPTYNDCFWDTQTSGQATSAGGTGKTTAQMKQEATFTNWDFSTIWAIVEDTSYPTLR